MSDDLPTALALLESALRDAEQARRLMPPHLRRPSAYGTTTATDAALTDLRAAVRHGRVWAEEEGVKGDE